jgi:hypothetical protein
MDTQQVAETFAGLLMAGKLEEAGETFWSPAIVSIEPMGPNPRSEGLAAVRAKGEWWYKNHEVHAFKAEGPYVNGNQFIMKFFVDVTSKESGMRIAGDEMGLYTVKDGKIIEEKFFGMAMATTS